MVYSVSYLRTRMSCFEVDSTESIWYTRHRSRQEKNIVLKLTPQSQYGIRWGWRRRRRMRFEVDSTESIWYILPRRRKKGLRVLKLTPQSQYGILRPAGGTSGQVF